MLESVLLVHLFESVWRYVTEAEALKIHADRLCRFEINVADENTVPRCRDLNLESEVIFFLLTMYDSFILKLHVHGISRDSTVHCQTHN